MRYAGEKFLHSSLLLIQSLMLVYAKEALAAANNHDWLVISVRTVILGLFSLTATTAGASWFLGFRVLNSQLWANWQRRIEDMNKATANVEHPEKAEATAASGNCR